MRVPSDKTHEVFNLIWASAQALGLITEIEGKKYVDLKGAGSQIPPEQPPDLSSSPGPEGEEHPLDKGAAPNQPKSRIPPTGDESKRRRVFITHGKDKSFVEPIRKLLKFGELEAVIAVERSSVSQPVPDKVMDDMRSCGAAIIHIDAEQKFVDKDGKDCFILNPNVLIEIGAAMALFGRRYIFLVRSGITLPSNLRACLRSATRAKR